MRTAQSDALLAVIIPQCMFASTGEMFGEQHLPGWTSRTTVLLAHKQAASSRYWPSATHQVVALFTRGNYAALLDPATQGKLGDVQHYDACTLLDRMTRAGLQRVAICGGGSVAAGWDVLRGNARHGSEVGAVTTRSQARAQQQQQQQPQPQPQQPSPTTEFAATECAATEPAAESTTDCAATEPAAEFAATESAATEECSGDSDSAQHATAIESGSHAGAGIAWCESGATAGLWQRSTTTESAGGAEAAHGTERHAISARRPRSAG